MMSHNDFPKMTDQFDQRVRQTLDSLPEQPQRVRQCTCIRLGPAVPRCAATHTLPTREPMRIDHTAKKGLNA